jgi:hypothetical protein
MAITAEQLNTDLTKVYAKKLILYTKSLGRIYTSVCSVSAPQNGAAYSVITTAGGANKGTPAYVADPSDYLLISSI